MTDPVGSVGAAGIEAGGDGGVGAVKSSRGAATAAPAKTKAPTSFATSTDAAEKDVTPLRKAWTGWAVKAPPPKVDLKAEMEAAAAAAASAPAPSSPSSSSLVPVPVAVTAVHAENGGTSVLPQPLNPKQRSRGSGDDSGGGGGGGGVKAGGKGSDRGGGDAVGGGGSEKGSRQHPPPPLSTRPSGVSGRVDGGRGGVEGGGVSAPPQPTAPRPPSPFVSPPLPPPPASSPPLTLPPAPAPPAGIHPVRPFRPPPAPPCAPSTSLHSASASASAAAGGGGQQPAGGVPASPLTPSARAALARRLGAEMLETAHVQPFSAKGSVLRKERRAVDVLVGAVNAIVQTLYPGASVELFGSFPTASWVPGASNLDMALCLPEAATATPQAKMDALNSLAVALRSNEWVTDVNVVPSAHRPLIFMSTHSAFFQPLPFSLPPKHPQPPPPPPPPIGPRPPPGAPPSPPLPAGAGTGIGAGAWAAPPGGAAAAAASAAANSINGVNGIAAGGTAAATSATSFLNVPAAGTSSGAAAPAAAPPLPPGPPPLPPIPPPGMGVGLGLGLGQGGVGLPLEVHISIKDRNHKGIPTVRFLQQAELEYPALTPLLSVQKAYLANRGLRGVYKGGIGSYSLALLALHSLQTRAHEEAEEARKAAAAAGGSGGDGAVKPLGIGDGDGEGNGDGGAAAAAVSANGGGSRVPISASLEPSDDEADAKVLGESLLHFLEFYGHEVDLTRASVKVHPLKNLNVGVNMSKAEADASGGAQDASTEWGVLPLPGAGNANGAGHPMALGGGMLQVVDPLQAGHNAGGGCFGVMGVQAAFREQLQRLVSALPADAPLLQQLLGATPMGVGGKICVV